MAVKLIERLSILDSLKLKIHMKKLLLVCALLFSAVTFTQAQDAKKEPTPQEISQKRAASLEKRLSLTADQKAKAEAIYLDHANQIVKLTAEGGDDKKALSAKKKQLTADTEVKLDAVLTAEQKAKYAAWKEAAAKKKAEEKKTN